MVHVFFIVNNINKVICEEYVRSECIPKNKVIFIFRRRGIEASSYTSFYGYKDLKSPYLTDKDLLRFIVSVVRFRISSMGKIDRRFREITNGSKCHIYVPHIYQDDLSFFATHPLCVHLSLVEEGDASYNGCSGMDPFLKIKSRNRWERALVLSFFGLKRRLKTEYFFPPEGLVRNALCMSNSAFPMYSKKKIVLEIDKLLRASKNKIKNKIAFIAIAPLILDLDQEDHVLAFRRFIKDHKKFFKDRDLYLSFHPTIRVDIDFCSQIESVLHSEWLSFEVFSGNAERLLFGSTEGGFVASTVTSLFRYCSRAGLSCLSWLKYLPNHQSAALNSLILRYESEGVCCLTPCGR